MSALRVTYVKTEAGVREVAARSLRLPANQRRLLILIDGERDVAQLANLLGADAVAAQLAELEAAGLIMNPSAPPQVSKPDAAPVVDPSVLQHARALMCDSAMRHLGLLGKTLAREIESAESRGELLSLSARWHMAMRASRDGHQEADVLLGSLRRMLALA